MMILFKKGIHFVMGLPSAFDTSAATTQKHHQLQYHHPISSLAAGLGLIAATRDVKRIPNVLESATVKPSTSPAMSDHGRIAFIDDIGGGVDGLMSCTESLGFESSDERRVDDQIEETNDDDDKGGSSDSLGTANMTVAIPNWRKPVGYQRRQVKSFPPPISSLNRNGQPNFFLRPVRKDGRLELTEVRIHRPEILHASREDGRLRLHLIRDDSVLDILEEEEEEELEEEVAELDEEIGGGEEEEEDEKSEEISESIGEWKFPMGSEGSLTRCHQVVNHHHHHHHHLHVCGVSIV